MQNKELQNSNEVISYIITNLNYNEENGFSFLEIPLHTDIKYILDKIKNPDNIELESEQQQTVEYILAINHPTHGLRAHHKLSVLFWAFEKQPIEIIKLHFSYFNTGEEAESYSKFIKVLFNQLIEKFGEPSKKSLRNGKEELNFMKGKAKMIVWNNTEGLRIQIK